MPSEQTYLPGTEPPDRIPDVDERVYAWLEAKEQQRQAADTAKIRHDSLLEELTGRGLERYSYLDPSNGNKRWVVVKREPKATTVKAASSKKQDRNDAKAERRAEKRARDRDESVEHRKVPRIPVTDELPRVTVTDEVAADPFAAVRKQLEPETLGTVEHYGEIGDGREPEADAIALAGDQESQVERARRKAGR